jgi:hypothetical protein
MFLLVGFPGKRQVVDLPRDMVVENDRLSVSLARGAHA